MYLIDSISNNSGLQTERVGVIQKIRPTIQRFVIFRGLNQLAVPLVEREKLLFATLIVLHLIPIWAFTYFPSQDGPAHLANANIIREYSRPDLTAFHAYYEVNEKLTPNWLGHLLLAGLLSFMPTLVAEKVFLSAYVILLPISARYAISAVRGDAVFLSVLIFPFIYNYLLHMGFYSFSYSLLMFFFVFGYWLRYRENFTLRRLVVLSVLSLLLYFGHVISMIATYFAIGFMTIWLMVIKIFAQAHRGRLAFRGFGNAMPMLKPFYAFVPTVTLCAIFTVQKDVLAHGLSISWEDKPSPRMLMNHLVSVYSLVSYDHWEVWLSRAFAGLFAAVILYLICSRNMKFRPTFQNGLLLIASAYAVTYVFGPSEIGGGSYVHDRMNLFPFLMLILWFAAHAYARSARRFIQGAVVGITVTLLVLHSVKYQEMNEYMKEYLSGMLHIKPNTTLLPISFSQWGDTSNGKTPWLRVDLFLNAAGYIATERRVVDLSNYEASQTNHFPILFRPNLNPAINLRYAPLDKASGQLRALPTKILTYPQSAEGSIDYVLVWGVRDGDRNKEIPRSIFKQLHQGYDLIYTSPQRGLAQLYRRKDLNLES